MAGSPRERRSRLLRGAGVGLGVAVAALFLWAGGGFQRLEQQSYDWRVRLWAEREEASEELALILLDQASLDWAQEEQSIGWPWPRELYAYILMFLERAEVKSTAFDVLYLEPSGYGVFDDESFGTHIGESGRFAGAMFLSREAGSGEFILARGGRARLDATTGTELLPEFPRAQFPIEEVGGNSLLLGNVHAPADSDGVYRRIAPAAMFDGRAIPSLGLAAYLAGEGEGTGGSTEQEAFAAEIINRTLQVEDREIPLDVGGYALLRYKGGRDDRPAFSAAAILQSELQLQAGEEPIVDPAELTGRYVMFGFSAPGLFDLRPSPLASNTPGVEIHATFLENLLSDSFMRVTPLGLDAIVIVLFSVLAAFAVSFAGSTRLTVAVYALVLPLPALTALSAYIAGWWLPLAAPTGAAVLALASAGVANYATEGRQRRFIKNAFSQYLSPAVIENLINEPDRLTLGGERRELSIFFSDLEGFTSLSEGLSPEDLTALLNEYLSAMTDIIQEEGGTIDKYEGDAIIAFWNAPLSFEDHAERAVRAALRCQTTLAELRPQFRRRVGKDLRMRIGINTGPAVVGNMGSRTRFDYTMLGDAVNLAARLEGINKQFGTYTMISADTAGALGPAFALRELSRVAVVGRAEPVTVYEPLTEHEAQDRRDTLAAFAAPLQLYYAGEFERARSAFERIADADPPAARYAERCRQLGAEPPPDWNGVWVMTSK